jgi:hypothetical protein
MKKIESIIFVLPLFFLLFAYLIYLESQILYNNLFGILETGFFEWIQFTSYLASAMIGFLTFNNLRKNGVQKNAKYLMILFSLGCFFVAFEEISWGQHIFNWVTPDSFSKINLQKETNIHNLQVIQGNNIQVKAMILVGYIGGLGWLLRFNVKKLSIKDLILTEWYVMFYFLPIAFFYTQLLYVFRWGNDHQETFETLLSLGFLCVAVINHRKVKDHLKME